MALTEHSDRNLPSYHSVHKISTAELVPQLWGDCGGYLNDAIAKYWLKNVMIVNNESEKKNAKRKSRVIIESTFSAPALRCWGNYEKFRHSRCSVWDSHPWLPEYHTETFPTETSLSVWPQSWEKYSNPNLSEYLKIWFDFLLKIHWYGSAYEKFRILSDGLIISSIFYHISLFHPNSVDHISCPSNLGCNSNLKTKTENRRK